MAQKKKKMRKVFTEFMAGGLKTEEMLKQKEKEFGWTMRSDGQSKGADDSLALPSHSAAPISITLPEARTYCNPAPFFCLITRVSFKWFSQLDELV